MKFIIILAALIILIVVILIQRKRKMGQLTDDFEFEEESDAIHKKNI